MLRQTGIWLLALILLLPAMDSIPPAWGKLVSVTTNPAFPSWFQLWFEDESSTIRLAAFVLAGLGA
jgi:hypothetical protein